MAQNLSGFRRWWKQLSALGVLLGYLLQVPSFLKDSIDLAGQGMEPARAATTADEPVASVPPPALAAPESPQCFVAHTISIAVIDLRSGNDVPEISEALSHELARIFRVGEAASSHRGRREPNGLTTSQATPSGPPAVSASGRLVAADRSIVEPHTEDYEISGRLELRVLSEPCAPSQWQVFDLEARARGHLYHEALAALGMEFAREFRRVFAERASAEDL